MTRKSFPRALSAVSICVILLSSLAVADTSLFLPTVSHATGGKLAWTIAVADLNGDGRPDIIAVNYVGEGRNSDGSVSVFLGNGDGTFRKPVVYDSGGAYPTAIAVADLNHDGKPDLVVFEECQKTLDNCVGVFLGNGDGTFQSKGVYATGGQGAGGGMTSPLVIGDLNGDGKPDLIVLNRTRTGSDDGVLGVLIGNGDGTFQPVVTYDVGGYYSNAIAAGDLNGDGNLDVAVSVCAPTGSTSCPGPGDQTVAVFLGIGDGTFRPATSYDTGGAGYTYANSVVIADVNGDGKPDLLVGNACTQQGGHCVVDASVGVLLNKGDGTFRAATTYAAVGGVDSLIVADMNGDGKPDLVVGGWPMGVLLGNGDGTFQPVKNSSSGGTLIAVADLDGDGKPDLVGTVKGFVPAGSASSEINVLLNNGDGTFKFPLVFSSGGAGVSGFALADLNGDGRPDLVASNGQEAGTVGVLVNNKNFVYGPTVTTLSASPNPALIGQTVTYTAVVTSVLGQSLSGTVTFSDGTKKLGSSTVTNGQAVWQASYSQKKNHLITAFYTGNQNDSSAGVSERIVQPPVATKTKVTSSGSPSHSGQPVMFTATVTSEVGDPPDGELVNFYDGSQLLGSVALAGGAAMYTTSSLSVGQHTINASYGGDAIFLSSTGHVKQVVKP